MNKNSKNFYASIYYPFGMVIEERSKSYQNYRFGFNGKEQDHEVSGGGNQYDYGFRIYDPRIGKFLSTDPLSKSYPWYTPYQFAGNKPISSVDIEGLEEGTPELLRFDPRTTFYIQYEGRASALVVTGSNAIGIGFVVDLLNPSLDEIFVYNTRSLGVSVALGANTGWTGGFSTADNSDEFSSWGGALGVYATAQLGVGVSGAIEVNAAVCWENSGLDNGVAEDDINVGITAALPIQIGGVGTGGGIYLEGSYTDIIATTNSIGDAMEILTDHINEQFDIQLSEKMQNNLQQELEKNIHLVQNSVTYGTYTLPEVKAVAPRNSNNSDNDSPGED